MPTPPLDPKRRARVVADLLSGKYSYSQMSRRNGVSNGTIFSVKAQLEAAGKLAPKTVEVTAADIRKALKRGAMRADDLADALNCTPRRVRELLAEMKAGGAMLIENGGRYDLRESMHLEPGRLILAAKPGLRRYGVVSDNHLCNKHSRLDVLTAAYDYFAAQGIDTVFNAGNWIDGEARFNKTELVTAPGMDNQLDYMIDKYPQRAGIVTHYIAGDDHEGWYQQREGIEVGRYLQMKAERAGRSDLKYLGYGEADVMLKSAAGSACMRVVHPGGGSSYAISYTDQKRVESYQGGEKPQIEIAGHYHKFNYGFPREVHTVQTGCTCDQTMFMRKKRLQAHVGFIDLAIEQDSQGCVTRFGVEWHPFYDRGFYERRFA